MGTRVHLDADGRRDKNTEKTSFRMPYQLKQHIVDYARKNGYSLNQAIKRLLITGVHVSNLKHEDYCVEPLEENEKS